MTDDHNKGVDQRFEAIMQKLETWDSTIKPTVIHSFLQSVSDEKLTSLHLERIYVKIKEKTNMTLTSLRKEVAAHQRASATNEAILLANEALSQLYESGDNLVRVDKTFWVYNGKFWESLSDEQMRHQILNLMLGICDKADQNENLLYEAFNILVSLRAVSGDPLNFSGDPPPVINCNNGELWLLEDGKVELRPHRFDSYLTYVLSVDYEPEATCPRMDQALLDIFSASPNPEEMRRHFYEMVGYFIQPNRFLNKWFMWMGSGSNGKTKLFQTIEKLIPQNAIHAARINTIEHNRFALGDLRGKLMLVDDDVDVGTKLPDGLIKKLSEPKLLTGEAKFKPSFGFISRVAILLLSNSWPKTADVSHGLKRRTVIVPFKRIFRPDEQDHELFPAIWKNEMSGVLNQAIMGLQRVRDREDFDLPQDCMDAFKEWERNSHPLEAFVHECCQKDMNSAIPLKEFMDKFKVWLEYSNMTYQTSSQNVRLNLEHMGYKCSNSTGVQRIYGLRVNDLPK